MDKVRIYIRPDETPKIITDEDNVMIVYMDKYYVPWCGKLIEIDNPFVKK